MSLLTFQSVSVCSKFAGSIGKSYLPQKKKKREKSDLSKGLYISQPAFTCSKLTKETIEQGMKYVQSYQ